MGFVEGDGSFGIRDGHLVFVINQAEIEILQKIRAELGFGIVFTYQQQGRLYERFTVWVKKYNENVLTKTEQIQIQPRRFPTDISLKNAWLSGFFDAEGGFFADISQQNTEKKYLRLRLNAYVDQKNEFDVLKQIAFLFDVSKVTVRSVKKQTYRVQWSTKKALKKILFYFEEYKLHSKKHLVYAMWRKIVFSYLENSHFENMERLKRRIVRIQKQNRIFKELKTVFPK